MPPPFLSGVVEGFYGRPWTFDQRHRMIDWLKQFGLNTYCFAPKDDLKHRVLWREWLDANELNDFEKFIGECRANDIQFIYSISPGWDDHFEDLIGKFDPHKLVADLKNRFQQLIKIGCTGFAIQFDDVPNLNVEQRQQLALWHAETCNALHDWLRDAAPDSMLIMCPAVYCSAMAEGNIRDCDYLRTLGAQLHVDVQVFWTGPNIISESITAEHLRAITDILKRPPLLWDNLNANDYDPSRPQLGPFANRAKELPGITRGVLLNPNCQFELNFVPLFTLGNFVESQGNNSEQDAVETAAQAWLPAWERIVGEPFSAELIQWVVDCFYLPFQNGERGNELLQKAVRALGGDADSLRFIKDAADRLNMLFHDLATLRNRDLLDALWSPVWKLKDELELIGQLAERPGNGPHPLPDFPDKIVRGGLIRELQQLTRQHGANGYSREK